MGARHPVLSGHRRTSGAACALALISMLAATCGGPAGPPALPTLNAAVQPAPTVGGRPAVSGPLSSPGGPFLYDSHGRVVLLHGVNAVYKLPPYELYPDQGKPWNLGPQDASLMAQLGFNVVRLGMTWKGLEPGTAPANDPAVCAKGAPRDPGQFDRHLLDSYLAKLAKTVDLLGRYHIYSLLDMHQDVYNEAFDGEGAPDWAVCTDGVPSVHPPGRWSLEYGTRAAGVAFHNFWTNDVVGDLQGEYDRVWAAVAAYFESNPWVVGYDPFNEPFSASVVTVGDKHFDGQLECFYAGKSYVGPPVAGGTPITCPAQDPAVGVIPTILKADPNHLVFYEPDIYGERGYPNFVGPMDFPNLVFNVHVYCGYRNPVTGNPTDLPACSAQDASSLATREADRPGLASAAQPTGPAWFVSEFGATSNSATLSAFTAHQDMALVGWTYWSWKYYDDPTGSADEALVMADGNLRSTARVLSRTYPEAVAGTPVSMSFDPSTATFSLIYTANHAVRAPTVVFVPTQLHYPDGYCARVSGGRVVSKPGSKLLEVSNRAAAGTVRIAVTSGACP
ncbi:MAG TPA: cellulase family glycosylhydrolase [Acidimicrobiales bacterium]|nr:cellulase family glycosylhydrolase [Acidimicrobiales bacterium]